MKKYLFAFSIILATQAYAQERPTLQTYFEEISGQEVMFKGRIGYSQRMNRELVVVPDGTHIQITSNLALQRHQLAMIAECSARGFDRPSCVADISAEVDFTNGRITLLLFDVQNVFNTN